ncbi:MAG TPA: hypothetical protein PK208_06810 [Fibrobacteria bacterium]|nr:hypothetical protein [Fibrobacteria bacterium]
MKTSMKHGSSLAYTLPAAISLWGCASSTLQTNHYAGFSESAASRRTIVVVRSAPSHTNTERADYYYKENFKEPGIPDKRFLAQIDSALIGGFLKACGKESGIAFDTALRADAMVDSLQIQLEDGEKARVAMSKEGMSAGNLYFVYSPLVFHRGLTVRTMKDPMQEGKDRSLQRDEGYGRGNVATGRTPYLEIDMFWGLYDPKVSKAIAGGKISDLASTASTSAEGPSLFGNITVTREDWFRGAAKEGANVCEVAKSLRR